MGRKRKADVYANGDVRLGWAWGRAIAIYPHEGSRRGKRVRLFPKSKYPTETVEEAQRALDAFAEARKAVASQAATPTIGECWRLWMENRAQDQLRCDVYEFQWRALGPFWANRYPSAIKDADGRAYARQRFDAGKKAWTVHTELVRLRSCLNWAASRRHIPFAPHIWVPAPGKHRTRVLTFDEMVRLLSVPCDPHVHLFIVLAFTTGARKMAILDLTWNRVDFAIGTIQYDEDVDPDPMSKSWRKGRATVPMNKMAREALERAYKGRQTKYVIEHGGERLKDIKSGFAAAATRAGLATKGPHKVTPHTIRHTISTWLKERGVGLEMRAQFMGHADSRITDTVYSHADPSYLGPAVEIIDQALPALPKLDSKSKPRAKPKGGKKR